MREGVEIGTEEITRVQWLPPFRVECLRELQRAPNHEREREESDEIEDGMPAKPLVPPAAEHGWNRGGDGENHSNVRHDPLRVVTFVHIAHHRATHNQPGAGGDPAQGAKEPARECLAQARNRGKSRPAGKWQWG